MVLGRISVRGASSRRTARKFISPFFWGGLVGETELAAPSNDVPLHENFWVGGLFYSGSDRSWSDLLTGYPKKASNLRVEPH